MTLCSAPSRLRDPLTRRTLLAGAGAALLLRPQPAEAAHDFNAAIPWQPPEPGLAAAKAAGRPVFLLVEASWCDACGEYARLFHDPRVVAALAPYSPVRADRDAHREVHLAWMPDGPYVPRSLILDAQGQHRAGITGPFPQWKYYLSTKSVEGLLDYLARGLA